MIHAGGGRGGEQVVGTRKKEKENRTRLEQNLEDSWRQATAQSTRLQQDQPGTSGRGARMEERKRSSAIIIL